MMYDPDSNALTGLFASHARDSDDEDVDWTDLDSILDYDDPLVDDADYENDDEDTDETMIPMDFDGDPDDFSGIDW